MSTSITPKNRGLSESELSWMGQCNRDGSAVVGHVPRFTNSCTAYALVAKDGYVDTSRHEPPSLKTTAGMSNLAWRDGAGTGEVTLAIWQRP